MHSVSALVPQAIAPMRTRRLRGRAGLVEVRLPVPGADVGTRKSAAVAAVSSQVYQARPVESLSLVLELQGPNRSCLAHGRCSVAQGWGGEVVWQKDRRGLVRVLALVQAGRHLVSDSVSYSVQRGLNEMMLVVGTVAGPEYTVSQHRLLGAMMMGQLLITALYC